MYNRRTRWSLPGEALYHKRYNSTLGYHWPSHFRQKCHYYPTVYCKQTKPTVSHPQLQHSTLSSSTIWSGQYTHRVSQQFHRLAPNPYGVGEVDLLRYRFGVCTCDTIKLIKEEHEQTKIPWMQREIVIIGLGQIPPESPDLIELNIGRRQ